MQVGSLGLEDSLEEEMATYSSIIASRIPWTEETDRLQCIRSQSRTQLNDLAFMHKGRGLSPQVRTVLKV